MKAFSVIVGYISCIPQSILPCKSVPPFGDTRHFAQAIESWRRECEIYHSMQRYRKNSTTFSEDLQMRRYELLEISMEAKKMLSNECQQTVTMLGI